MPISFMNHSAGRWLDSHHNKKLHKHEGLDPERVTQLAEIYQHMDADGR